MDARLRQLRADDRLGRGPRVDRKYLIRPEVAEGIDMTFFHLDVYYMGPSILKIHACKAWKEYRHTLPERLFTMGDRDSDALRQASGAVRLSISQRYPMH
jgi:hypothetical protein